MLGATYNIKYCILARDFVENYVEEYKSTCD